MSRETNGDGDDLRAIREAMARHTGTEAEDWYPVLKARFGILETMRAIAAEHGQVGAAVQAFTCCTAITPVITGGLAPVYLDIDPDSLSLRVESDDEVPDGGAIMLQHTFGIIDETGARATAAAAHRRGAVLVEDCAHAVGRMARDESARPLADVSIHSFGVQKILPTRFGGAVWVSPELDRSEPAIATRLRGSLGSLPRPSARQALAVRGYRGQTALLARTPRPVAAALRSAGESLGGFEPPVSRAEQDGGMARPVLPTPWAARRAAAELEGLGALQARLARTADALRDCLSALDRARVPSRAVEGSAQPLLRVPVILPTTAQAEGLISALRAAGVYAEPWGRPLLYPGVVDPGRYGLPEDPAALPVSREVSRGVVALPTDLPGGLLDRCTGVLRASLAG